ASAPRSRWGAGGRQPTSPARLPSCAAPRRSGSPARCCASAAGWGGGRRRRPGGAVADRRGGQTLPLRPTLSTRSTPMYRYVLPAVAGCLVLAGSLAGADKEEGFVPLFNGKDLDGWVIKGKKEGWQVKDGVIRSEGARGGDWMRTKKEYGDFVL